MKKQICWVYTYVSRAALTPNSWCVIVSSPPYQIREEENWYNNGYFLSTHPEWRWLHTWPLSLGSSGSSVCHLCALTVLVAALAEDDRALLWYWNMLSMCWLWHRNTHTLWGYSRGNSSKFSNVLQRKMWIRSEWSTLGFPLKYYSAHIYVTWCWCLDMWILCHAVIFFFLVYKLLSLFILSLVVFF